MHSWLGRQVNLLRILSRRVQSPQTSSHFLVYHTTKRSNGFYLRFSGLSSYSECDYSKPFTCPRPVESCNYEMCSETWKTLKYLIKICTYTRIHLLARNIFVACCISMHSENKRFWVVSPLNVHLVISLILTLKQNSTLKKVHNLNCTPFTKFTFSLTD